MQSDGRAGRVDLLLQRRYAVGDGYRRLVVELKRPSVALRPEHLEQVRGYARTLSKSDSITAERWQYWLVGSEIHEDTEASMQQLHRRRGHVEETAAYDMWVTSSGELIDQALHRYELLRNDLDEAVDQESTLERVRERYGELIPKRS